MHILRTRFKDEIVAEFLPPEGESSRAIILCNGMPSVPDKEAVMRFYSERGFWVFFPRYRGSWESDGRFLAQSPHIDVLDVVETLTSDTAIVSLWDGEKYTQEFEKIYVLGASFGGAAAILASIDTRVDKAVALSPVVDWTVESPDEPFDHLKHFTGEAFGRAYRFDDDDFDRLKTGDVYNPTNHIDDIDSNKLLIIYTADDRIVTPAPTDDFVAQTDCKSHKFPDGGHLSGSQFIEGEIAELTHAFLSES